MDAFFADRLYLQHDTSKKSIVMYLFKGNQDFQVIYVDNVFYIVLFFFFNIKIFVLNSFLFFLMFVIIN